jgi:hypothetical protein
MDERKSLLPESETLSKLKLWQERLAKSRADYSKEESKMDERERLYNGKRELTPLVQGDTKKDGSHRETSHVRNIVFENIESMISSSIPTPKVTPRRKQDEHLAAVIEHWLRNELNRLPFETMNDMAERTVPVQGGAGWLVEWDNSKRTHDTVGEISVTLLHPKQFAPQPGVFTGINDMDWFIVKAPTTVGSVKREYGVDLRNQSESEPQLRGTDGVASQEELLTKYIGYEKNETGGVDRFVWVNNTMLEDIEDYQARHQEVCTACRRTRPMPGQIISNNVQTFGDLIPDPARGFAGGLIPQELLERELDEETAATLMAMQLATQEMDAALYGDPYAPDTGRRPLLGGMEINAGQPGEPVKYDGGPCPYCGNTEFTDAEAEYEEIMLPIKTKAGNEIPGASFQINEETGLAVWKPTLVPFYKPSTMPIVLQRNVSVYGKLLGNSDVEAIADQQNTVNRLEQKIIDRLMKAGTRITMPPLANLTVDTNDQELWHLSNIQDVQYIRPLNFSGNIESELAYLTMTYEEARQILGITNSFQGREDRTATSGVAKEFQAAQSAGRLESKRVMKAAAYAELFELMFKFQLAYSDEPRPISYKDHKGDTVYEEFNRYDFLEQDADGEWYWNDQFLFSVDSNEALENNRAAMWQETRMNLQSGAFGDPTQTDTLILFWGKMEELHYPGAGTTKKFLEEKQEREQQAAQAMAMMQNTGAGGMGGITGPGGGALVNPTGSGSPMPDIVQPTTTGTPGAIL